VHRALGVVLVGELGGEPAGGLAVRGVVEHLGERPGDPFGFGGGLCSHTRAEAEHPCRVVGLIATDGEAHEGYADLVTINQSTFTNNTSSGDGGAVDTSDTSAP
jgi:predicted outer membrane repeat protein